MFICVSMCLSMCSQIASPKSSQQRTDTGTTGLKSADSHVSLSPSIHSSEDRPRSRATTSRPQSQPSRTGGESLVLSFLLFLFFIFL